MSESRQAARPCPVCGGPGLAAEPAARSPLLWRCRGCGLSLRDQPLSSATEEEFDRDQMQKLGAGKAALFERGLRRFEPYHRIGRLLDIGCGSGYFARAAVQAGWRVVGVEPSAYLVRFANELSDAAMTAGTATALPLTSGAFDVVTLWDVLDYLSDPVSAFEEALRVLRPGGLLYARVRNGPLHLALRRWPLVPGRASVIHTIQYSRHTLELALARAGFRRVRVDTAAMTRGDPYQRTSGAGLALLRALKRGWGLGALALARVSARRVLIGPSIEATAIRPEGSVA